MKIESNRKSAKTYWADGVTVKMMLAASASSIGVLLMSSVAYADSASIPVPSVPGMTSSSQVSQSLSSASISLRSTGPEPINTPAVNPWNGININLPPSANTIDPDWAGIRSGMESAGFNYFGYNQDYMASNVLHSSKQLNGQQVYNGQQTTGVSVNFIGLTFDLSRFGIPDGQIVGMGFFGAVSWNALGPNTDDLGTLSYYQTMFHRKIEFKIGLLANSFEYGGPYVAGSLSGGVFGPSGSLFFEGGMSGTSYPSYGFNITLHPTKAIYDKFGVSRALDPDGTVAEHVNNPIGVNLNTRNSGAYFINEAGYLVKATPGSPQTWVRLGASYSASRYANFDDANRRTMGDYVVYLLGDRQIWQPTSTGKLAYRGLYVGFSAEYAPPEVNRFSEYYEARIYGLGLVPSRLHDQVSFLVTDTDFSNILVGEEYAAHQLTHHTSQAVTFSYSAEAVRGVYVNAAVGYVNNPSPIIYNTHTGSALNLFLGLSIFL